MHRKSKSTAGHAMNVTNLITFSKGYQRGEARTSIVLVLALGPLGPIGDRSNRMGPERIADLSPTNDPNLRRGIS